MKFLVMAALLTVVHPVAPKNATPVPKQVANNCQYVCIPHPGGQGYAPLCNWVCN